MSFILQSFFIGVVFFLFFFRHTVGDTKVPFCLQSCVKPLKYAVAVNDHGTQYVHSFIGKEPSGLRFNKLFLNEDGENLFFSCCYVSIFYAHRVCPDTGGVQVKIHGWVIPTLELEPNAALLDTWH